MRRMLSLWLPTFATDLVRRRLRKPLPGAQGDRTRRQASVIVLTRQVGTRELVARRCAHGAEAGISEGIDLAHARSLLPPKVFLHTEPHRPDQDQRALHALACWSLRFSPLVAPDSPDGLAIDITGTERVHGGEPRLIRTAAAAFERLGFQVRIAAASTLACGWCVARFGMHDLASIPLGHEREALNPLPVGGLRVDDETVLGLSEVGITTIKHVLDLRRPSVMARFSPVLLDRLDQALGRKPEHIEPVRPAPPPRTELLFEGPTDHWESIQAAAHNVLNDLVKELIRRGRGARTLDLKLLRPQSPPDSIEVNLSRPSCNTKHLWSLVRSRLEKVDLGQGVEGLILTATRVGRLRHEQTTSSSLGGAAGVATAAAWGELVDTLVTRLGPDNVVRIEPVESHIPEHSFQERPVLEHPGRDRAATVTKADRPTLLFPQHEPAEVMSLTPDGPVLSLMWRGRQCLITSCIGPERIGAEWWRWGVARDEQDQPRNWRRRRAEFASPPPDRDYFAIQTEEGRWLWVYRPVGTGKWFVHGAWS